MSQFDADTGEVARAETLRMPPDIAAAIIKVMGETKQLGFDEKNQHGGYNYVSIDKFMSAMRPILSGAGIFIVMEEENVEVYSTEGKDKISQWLRVGYAITIYHASGASYGPLHRQCVVPASGAQAFASAQSYLLKYFMRALFQIPTGDKDADAEEAMSLPSGKGAARQTSTKAPAAPANEDRARVIFNHLAKAITESITATALDELQRDNDADLAFLKETYPKRWEELKNRFFAQRAICTPDATA